MTRTEFFNLVTEAGAEDRKVSLAARGALIDWWRDEGEQNAEAARELEGARDAQATAEEREASAVNAQEAAEFALAQLQASAVEMICSVCLHDIRHAPICRTCVEASVDRHVATYPSTHSLPRLAARA